MNNPEGRTGSPGIDPSPVSPVVADDLDRFGVQHDLLLCPAV
jgi:hypothetical protein